MFIKTKMAPAQPHDLLALSKYFDFMTIPLNYIEGLIKMGVPSSKIVVKIEFMGRGRISPETIHRTMGYNQVCEILSKDATTNWEKYYDHEIKANVAKRNNGIGKEMDIIIFPSNRNIANYMRYIVRNELAGAMAYNLNIDDYLGKCTRDNDIFNDFKTKVGITLHIPMQNYTKFPLLNSINNAIEVAIDEITQERNITQSIHKFKF